MEEPRKRLRNDVRLGIQYELGGDTRARTPHARSRLVTANGPLGVFTPAAQSRPVLLNS